MFAVKVILAVLIVSCLGYFMFSQSWFSAAPEAPRSFARSLPKFDFGQCLTEVSLQFPPDNEPHWCTKSCNAALRYDPIKPHPGCLILDVGGHTHAVDTQVFRKSFPECRVHVFEPVPPFYTSLRKQFEGQDMVVVHPFGLGYPERKIFLPKNLVHGQATFVVDKVGVGEDAYELKIMTIKSILDSIKADDVDLLNVNCEACEWELMPRIGEERLWNRFRIVQFSFHNYGATKETLVRKYCRIRESLSKSHEIVGGNGTAFQWERWERRKHAVS